MRRPIQRLTCAALLLVGFASLAVPAHGGLAAHEILVLVNQRSPRSMEVANHFVHTRRVPARNVIYLDLPDRVLEPAAELTQAEFERYIWYPAKREKAARGLRAQVLAWIYSVDFPVRITTDPIASLTGLTFLRNQLPADRDAIYRGQYLSPLFAGPDPDGRIAPGASFIRYQEALQDRMPLPAMMLGFCGSRGNDVDTVLRTIRYGQIADRSSPAGTVYWITGSDVRAEMRNWQFEYAQQELQAVPVRSDISDDAPVSLPGIIGLQMGQATVRADRAGSHLPGSMAEHATSHAAEFHLPIQTKITDWIRAGATASAGTVTEPYAAWPKFPHARFFGHYARGHSMIESFYMSLRSPAQTLLLGEPLTRPWATPLNMSLISVADEPLSGEADFAIALFPEMPQGHFEYRVIVNGEQIPSVSPQNRFNFDSNELPDGYNEIRAVSYARVPSVHSTMDFKGIMVDNHGRSVTILTPEPSGEQPGHRPLQIDIESTGEPQTVQLVHNFRVLAETHAATGSLTLDPALLGAGPIQLHARAIYDDEMEVLSPPFALTLQRTPTLPPATGEWRTWDRTDIEPSGGALTERDNGVHVFSPEPGRTLNWAVQSDPAEGLSRISVRLAVPGDSHAHPTDEIAGIIFDQQGRDTFRFFALHGEPSAWSFGEYLGGRLRHRIQRGAPLLRGTARDIDLVFSGNEVQAYVNGHLISTWDLPEPPSGHIGLMTARRTAAFHSVRYQINNIE